jgi:hypothetical protein
MKECNCGKIPPCYGSLEFAIYEEAKKVNDEWEKSRASHSKMIDKLRNKLMEGGFLDDTHDKVYELNKQMCDIGKTILTKNKDIMEEKKTKKMTKAEAFEWLKGKKVYANGKGKEVQMKLFECGVSWATNHFVYYDFGDYLLIDTDGYLYHCGHEGDSYWRAHHFEKISADDILSIEIVDENKKSEEEEALDKISCLGAQIVDILLHMKGHHHVTITETTVALYDEGMCLFHSDPF